jgi:GNAT superfamily N-acetyltransferase
VPDHLELLSLVPDRLELIPLGPDHAAEMARSVRMGMESYLAWTPPGWEIPTVDFEAEHIAEKLREGEVWGAVALLDGAHAGHVAGAPARTRDDARTPIPGMAHLWHLFVRPQFWGSGLASRLHALAIDGAAERRFPAMRLFTPAGNSRGRAFYEREGWRPHGEIHFEPMLGLEMLEYRRELPAPRGPAASLR